MGKQTPQEDLPVHFEREEHGNQLPQAVNVGLDSGKSRSLNKTTQIV
jgi:hypothetical protein